MAARLAVVVAAAGGVYHWNGRDIRLDFTGWYNGLTGADLWRLAWPMANLALWGQRWWGGRGGASADAHLSDLAQTA